MLSALTRIAAGAAGILLALDLASSAGPDAAQSTLPTITYEGYAHVRTDDRDTTYGQGLTHRYVAGELRLLVLTLGHQLHEFRPPAPGGTQTETTQRWDLGRTNAFLAGFHGIWYEQARNRLWITSTADYTTTNHPARITLVELGSAGSVRVLKQFFLDKPAKRVYGGCQAVPAALVSRLGGRYVCGWGGYTSLVAQGGGASIGPTMYAVPDPETVGNGATVDARTVLDAAHHRGVRKTIPINYFDGGDPRRNPSTRPTQPPVPEGDWLSPNADGLGWMVWGDSYYNTGTWIGTTFAAVASLCKGACWYQSSTLAFDDRQFELHLWDGTKLGSDPLQRPDRMTELLLPRGNGRVWSGNSPTGNIGGATYDDRTGRLYLYGAALGPDDFTARLYTFRVSGSGGGSPGPPVDAVVSQWSAWQPLSDWTSCTAGVETRTERRTRQIVTPATNGGATPALEQQRTVSRGCGQAAELTAILVAEGFDRPARILPHPTEAGVLVVVERSGRVRLVRNGRVEPDPMLDLSGDVGVSATGGLLDLAFDPDFATTGRAFVAFHDRAANVVLARLTAVAGTADRLAPSSRFDLVWPSGARFIGQPSTSDSSAHLAFGPDDYLYVSIGAGSASAASPYASQHPRSLLGKILRLDVAVPASNATGYRVPPDNPWARSSEVLQEIWAFGLRDARGWTLDATGTGGLIVPDAGESLQEISWVPVEGGSNLGWPHRHGRRMHLPSSPLFNAPLIDAMWERDASAGSGLIGGQLFRGRFFFGDVQQHRIWSVRVDMSTGSADDLVDHSAALGDAAVSPATIGVDASGSLMIATATGRLYRIGIDNPGRRPPSSDAVGRARPRD